MRKELDKVYSPKQFEDKIYQFWQEKEYFRAKPDPEKKPYTDVYKRQSRGTLTL